MNTTHENDALYQRTKGLVTKGKTVKAAMRETGIKHGAYYKRSMAKSKRAPRKLLNVIDLPNVVSDTRAFIVYGSPKQLAEFAKGMS